MAFSELPRKITNDAAMLENIFGDPLKISISQKEGMDSFLNFMSETGGIGLILFWIDAEAFKDALERARCVTEAGNLLFYVLLHVIRLSLNSVGCAMFAKLHRSFRCEFCV